MPIELGEANSPQRAKAVRVAKWAAVVIAAAFVAGAGFTWFRGSKYAHDPRDWEYYCRQPDVLEPAGEFRNTTQFFSLEYRNYSADLLGGAVRVPTESFDDMPVDPTTDKRYEVFSELHAYLNASFPLVSKSLELVNTYGLYYTVKGESPEQPTVLMGHQDVVPVDAETIDQWTYPPFSGHYDGERVWGRGSSDTKTSVVAILEAVENLLEQKWRPKHDVVLAFGFDEEVGGPRGAGHLADHVRARYGSNNSVSLIIDEGGSVVEQYGTVFALPGVAESGYTDVEVTVHTPGGHSSRPPNHTGIGIASLIIRQLENPSGWVTKFGQDDVIASTYQCYAAYGKDLSKAERKRFVDHNSLTRYLTSDRDLARFINYTQAVDVISGGVKINALPEQVTFVVNHRLSTHFLPDEVTWGVSRAAERAVKDLGLAIVVDNETVLEPAAGAYVGHVEITTKTERNPSLVSPYSQWGSEPDAWQLIGGTTRHVLETYFGIDQVVMAPAFMMGNTDTKHYAGLTENIYRYRPGLPNGGAHAHTVDEWTLVDSHLAIVAWYYELLQFV